jgi:drug/metabolite transporter (DMT)-like permease
MSGTQKGLPFTMRRLFSEKLSRGYLIALISALVLSTTAIFIRYLTQTYAIKALVLALWRDVFVSVILLILIACIKPALLRIPKKDLFFGIMFGFVMALFNSLWTFSVSVNGAAVSTVLVYSSAAFTALLGWWFLHETLNWGKVVAVFLSMVGCVLVAGALEPTSWQTGLLNIMVGISSGLFYAIYSLMGRSASVRGINPWTTLLYTFGFAAIFLLSFNIFFGGIVPGTAGQISDYFVLGNSITGWGVLLLLAAGPTLAGFGLYNTSLSLLPSSIANLIVTLEPVFTVILANLLFHEELSLTQLIGSVFILSGVVIPILFKEKLSFKSTSDIELTEDQ